MRQEINSIVFRTEPLPVKKSLVPRSVKVVPTVLFISGITCDDLPDSDKGIGGGGSDPYIKFTLETDLDKGDINIGTRYEARTKTLFNVGRRVRFPDVVEVPLHPRVASGFGNCRLHVSVWDDDSTPEGNEGVNDDLMGEMRLPLDHRMLKGFIDRATVSGLGGLNPFRLSFRYSAGTKQKALPPISPPPPSRSGSTGKLSRSKTKLAVALSRPASSAYIL